MSKFYDLVVRWLFVSSNGIKMQFEGVFGFKSSTSTVYCSSFWFVHQQRKTYSNLYVICWLSHLLWFQGPKYIPSSVWLQVMNHDVKSKISKKGFLRSLLFYTTVSWCWKVEEETQEYLWRSHEDFGMFTLPVGFYLILTYIGSISLCKISQLQESEMRPTGWTLSYICLCNGGAT